MKEIRDQITKLIESNKINLLACQVVLEFLEAFHRDCPLCIKCRDMSMSSYDNKALPT